MKYGEDQDFGEALVEPVKTSVVKISNSLMQRLKKKKQKKTLMQKIHGEQDTKILNKDKSSIFHFSFSLMC